MVQGGVDAATAATVLEEGLAQIARARMTGSLHVEISGTAVRARVYAVDGALYSVVMDGFDPQIVRRLLSSDLLTEAHVVQLADLGVSDAGQIGHEVLDRGWVGAHELSAIHHELLMASLQALLSAESAQVEVREGEITDRYCTAPVEWDEVRMLNAQRNAKIERDIAAIQADLGVRGKSFSSERSVLRARGDLAKDGSVPAEFARFHECLRAPRTVDQAAWECGFTRAEALHITAEFAAAGFVELVTRVGKLSQPVSHLVPEALPVPERMRRLPRHG